MQTYLTGRDMITPDEWTDDEVNTIFEVAFDLKRKRALGEAACAAARQGAGDDVLLLQHAHPHQL